MRKKYRGRLVSNFIALSIIQGTNFLLPVLVMPFVINRIGTEAFGVVSIAQVIMIYLSTVADFGFNLTATRDIAQNRNDCTKTSRIFFLVLGSKMLITFLSFLVLLLLVFFIPLFRQHTVLYLLGFTYVIGQSLLVSWFFQGMERMQYITVISLLSKLVFVALVFLFIRGKEDGLYFLFFLGMGNIIAGMLSIYLAIRMFGLQFIRPSWPEIRTEFREGWQITVSNLSINTYLYTNIFILRIFSNDLVVGYYSIAEKIFFAVRQLLGIFSQVIYPRICQMTVTGKELIGQFFKKVYQPFLLLMFACSGLLFLFAPQIISVFLHSRSGLSVQLLRLFSFVPVIVCLNIPAYQLLLAFNRKKSYSGVLATGTVVNIFANFILCSIWGAVGTVLSIIITELFITLGLNLQLYKNKLFYFIRLKPL